MNASVKSAILFSMPAAKTCRASKCREYVEVRPLSIWQIDDAQRQADAVTERLGIVIAVMDPEIYDATA